MRYRCTGLCVSRRFDPPFCGPQRTSVASGAVSYHRFVMGSFANAFAETYGWASQPSSDCADNQEPGFPWLDIDGERRR